jgi:hypothetical protein
MSLIDNNVIDGNTKSFISLNVFHLVTSMKEDKMNVWYFNATIKWIENELDLAIVIWQHNDLDLIMPWIMKT